MKYTKDENGNPTKKPIIYNDFTASGKGLKSVESFIQNQVLPTYANVHSTVGHNAEITSKYFLESKEILRNYGMSGAKINLLNQDIGQDSMNGRHIR